MCVRLVIVLAMHWMLNSSERRIRKLTKYWTYLSCAIKWNCPRMLLYIPSYRKTGVLAFGNGNRSDSPKVQRWFDELDSDDDHDTLHPDRLAILRALRTNIATD
eukprot:401310_1